MSVLISVLLRANVDGTYSVDIDNSNGEILNLAVPYSSLPTRIGLEMNANNSTIKLFFNGVEQVLSDNSYSPQNAVLEVVAGEVNILTGNFGLNCTARLITTAEDITTNFSSGATDIFGTPLP